MWTTYWFEIKDGEYEGEQFLTELKDPTRVQHVAHARKCFPNESIVCFGEITQDFAEMLGLDTY